MDEAAGDAGDEEGVVDLELDDMAELALLFLEHGVEAFGLGDGAGEAVEDESGGNLVNCCICNAANWISRRTLPCTPCCSPIPP